MKYAALLLLLLTSSIVFAEPTPAKIDAELNAVYQQALKILESNSTQKNKLIQNQRDWLKFSNGYCSLTDGHPITEQTMQCISDIKLQRITQLKNIHCEEGDMSTFCMIY